MYTFREYLPYTTSVEPGRNPLLEVRLLPFLRGDAYANPLHDLLYALSRSSKTNSKPRNRVRREFNFTEEGLIIVQPSGTETHYPWSEIDNLQLHFGQHHAASGMESNRSFFEYTRVTFQTGNMDYDFSIRIYAQDFLELCKSLLAWKVPFREFCNGMRSFLMDTTLTYREVQKVKREYGIVW